MSQDVLTQALTVATGLDIVALTTESDVCAEEAVACALAGR